MTATMERAAVLSPCGLYRYTLERHWDRAQGHALFVLLNPSTADATQDDPTLRRGIGFARAMGVGGVVFVNLFAFRSTDPRNLVGVPDPVGPDNDAHIEAQADRVRWMARAIVLAWGAYRPPAGCPRLVGRARAVLALLYKHRGELWCLGQTRDGSPRHPLYLPASTPVRPFRSAT